MRHVSAGYRPVRESVPSNTPAHSGCVKRPIRRHRVSRVRHTRYTLQSGAPDHTIQLLQKDNGTSTKPMPLSEASFPKSSRRGMCHHSARCAYSSFSKRLPDPHGQRSLRPSFSLSSFSPWTKRRPRLTCCSDGKPLRRLLVGSKGGLVVVAVVWMHGTPPESCSFGSPHYSSSGVSGCTSAQWVIRGLGESNVCWIFLSM